MLKVGRGNQMFRLRRGNFRLECLLMLFLVFSNGYVRGGILDGHIEIDSVLGSRVLQRGGILMPLYEGDKKVLFSNIYGMLEGGGWREGNI